MPIKRHERFIMRLIWNANKLKEIFCLIFLYWLERLCKKANSTLKNANLFDFENASEFLWLENLVKNLKDEEKLQERKKKVPCKSTLRCTRWIMQRQGTYTIRLIIHSFTVLNPFCLFRCILLLPTIFFSFILHSCFR